MNSETLRAITNCLIPPDDFPGAYEAGVCDYLERILRTDLAAHSDFFRTGIDSIDNEALSRHNTGFASLTLDQQISTLAAIESGDVQSSWSISPTQFFEMLVNTTAEGYYSDPQQGGNRGGISWVMTGFEPAS